MNQLYYISVLATVLTYSSGYAGYLMPVLLAIIIAEAVTRRFRWVPTRMDRPLAALLVVAFASGLVSAWRGTSLATTVLFALMVLVSVYPAARVARGRPEIIRPLVAVWIAGAVFAAAWGIARVEATWPNGASTPALLRTALGTTMAAAIALALGGWTVWEGRWSRAGLLMALPLLVTALELTTSRAAWIAGAAGAFAMVVLAPRRRLAVIVLCLLSLAVATAATTARREWLVVRLGSISSLEANADRLALWAGALRMVRDHPLLGTGYGTFVQAWGVYNTDPALLGKPTAHNVFLNFAAETGVIGLAAFVAVIAAGFTGLAAAIGASRGDRRTDGLWAALCAAVFAILVQQLFDGTVMSWHVGYGLLAPLAIGASYRDAGVEATRGAQPAGRSP
jgi:O-antigen ligase